MIEEAWTEGGTALADDDCDLDGEFAETYADDTENPGQPGTLTASYKYDGKW